MAPGNLFVSPAPERGMSSKKHFSILNKLKLDKTQIHNLFKVTLDSDSLLWGFYYPLDPPCP